MAGLVQKFFITSMLMWMAPAAILYSFNHNWFPGASSYNITLVSGLLAVISVNAVIAFYIYIWQ